MVVIIISLCTIFLFCSVTWLTFVFIRSIIVSVEFFILVIYRSTKKKNRTSFRKSSRFLSLQRNQLISVSCTLTLGHRFFFCCQSFECFDRIRFHPRTVCRVRFTVVDSSGYVLRKSIVRNGHNGSVKKKKKTWR